MIGRFGSRAFLIIGGSYYVVEDMNLTIVIINIVVVIVVIIMMMDQELLGKLEMADTRSENAEMDIGRLNVRIDKVVVMVMVKTEQSSLKEQQA